MTTATEPVKTTTWGDCPNSNCPWYGRMMYGVTPGETCYDTHFDAPRERGEGCDSELRWWDRWHDGKHGSTRDGCSYGIGDVKIVAAEDHFAAECQIHGTVTTQSTIEDAVLSADTHIRHMPEAHPYASIVKPDGRVATPA